MVMFVVLQKKWQKLMHEILDHEVSTNMVLMDVSTQSRCRVGCAAQQAVSAQDLQNVVIPPECLKTSI